MKYFLFGEEMMKKFLNGFPYQFEKLRCESQT
jgi:hypothetical protein